MSPTVREILERESIDDAAIIRHGFTDYMRDYEVIVAARNGPPNTDIHKYQFIGCAEAICSTQLVRTFHEPTSPFGTSLADDFVFSGPDYPEKDDPKGFIWGVRYADVLSGWIYEENGKRARFWSDVIGRKMHEVTVETNAYRLKLVFADIRYSFLGYEPEVSFPKDYPLPVTEPTSDGGVS
jgi:hypothetical protein